MRVKNKFIIITLMLVLLMGCNMPQATSVQNQGQAFTQAAKTLSAQLTIVAPSAPTITPTQVPIPTKSQTPANVILPSITPILITPSEYFVTATPFVNPPTFQSTCNSASFVGDITIPDNSVFPPNKPFQKIWRIMNIGTCSWSSGYKLVFDHGDLMGGTIEQILTTNVINPGQTLDVSISLVAPAQPGFYKGFWKIRDPQGGLFGITAGSPIWVQIQVMVSTTIPTSGPIINHTPTPTLTNSPTTIQITQQSDISGSIASNGAILSGYFEAGDTTINVGKQIFLSFDISSIPDTSMILDVRMDFSSGFSYRGNPFAYLGCLHIFNDQYGVLDYANDFVLHLPSNYMSSICNYSGMYSILFDQDFVTTLQSKVGSPNYQIRLQLDMNTNGDSSDDLIILGTAKLIITYKAP